MKSAPTLVIRIAVFAIVTLVLLVLVFQAIEHPIGGATEAYQAVFTDANGLHTGDDVRLYGVRVGKVDGTELDGTNARVSFTVQPGYSIYADTQLAIRYQSLTGKRYLDIQQHTNDTDRLRPGSTIGTARTIPAFDVTTLFNGLQPVLAELTPADLNRFTTSLLGVINGNGTGLGPALDAIERLGTYVTDRQAVISTLVHNMSAIAGEIGGQSGNAMVMLSRLTEIFVALQERSDGLIDFGLTIPPVLAPTVSLLRTLGLTGDPNQDFDNTLRTVFPDPKQAIDVFDRLPGLIQSLTALIPAAGSGVDQTCSHGAAQAPRPLQVLIGGQRITLCNR
ncbi:MlaD family protein [Nocardia jiangxiensis]|uniref:MlaD family protein n=1 Tax=Nocardia jiangxiensis TaxID=282685 RepID=A0ABW6S8M9_9NOCA